MRRFSCELLAPVNVHLSCFLSKCTTCHSSCPLLLALVPCLWSPQKNHLSGIKRTLLKISTFNTQQLMEVSVCLMCVKFVWVTDTPCASEHVCQDDEIRSVVRYQHPCQSYVGMVHACSCKVGAHTYTYAHIHMLIHVCAPCQVLMRHASLHLICSQMLPCRQLIPSAHILFE